MKRTLFAALALFSCSTSQPRASPAAAAPPPASRWSSVVDATDRPDADRKLDQGRKPAALLDFLDVKPGMKVAELGAGGGYTSELLARAVGPQGRVYAENPPQFARVAAGLDARAQRLGNLARVDRPIDDPLPPEAKELDLVVIYATYHDFVAMGADRARMNEVIFNALKPGGAYVVVDSSARAGTGSADARTLHRIDEQLVKDEVQKAGFTLAGESDFLRNPQDTRDWNSSPGAAGERRGTGDRFALKFVRPQGSQSHVIPPRLRLPGGAAPTHVTAELTIVPAEETFTGTEEIGLHVAEPLPILWLNADDLTVRSVQPAARILPGGADFVGLQFEQPLQPGDTTVRIEWQGKLSAKDFDGAFRQQENGAWYVITHLEALGARRVWPSFDEPSFKIPWRISLRVPKGAPAYFNTPVESRADAGNGLELVRFAQTKPLPSYLLAFGVGPFERVDAGRMQSGAPVGVVVTKGKTTRAAYSAASSPKLMNLLEDWFGIPYHYPKLDLIEIPLGTGAMENPGLISFNQRINLAQPGDDSPQFRRRAASVEAHEFAHLWFGDMVTTAWWDDIWLNEAFATWMESKIIEQFAPAWDEPAFRVRQTERAMQADRLMSARRIRQEIWSDGDIKTAFDAITYEKGAAVIAMFEQYVGPERFRAGVQRYLREHADGNATAKQFLAAISAEAGKDVAPAFSTFLDQPGLPVVSAKTSCSDGHAQVTLEQARYVPLGADASRAPPQAWQIPVCVRTDAGRSCTLLAGKTSTVALDRCPAWVMPNAGAVGYYRSQLDEPGRTALAAAAGQLTPPERTQMLSDVLAAARAGHADYAEAMALAGKLAADQNRSVVDATLEIPEALHKNGYVPETLAPAFAGWVRSVYGQRAHALGWKRRPNESASDSFVRPLVLSELGDAGADPATRAEAKRVALAWMRDHRTASQEVADAALHVAAIAGDQALWNTMHDAARREKDRVARQRLLTAMGAFRDPAVVANALPLALSSEFDPRESIPAIVLGASAWPATRRLALDFVKGNYDALASRLPRDAGATLARAGTAFCDEEHAQEVEEFFGPRSRRYAGGDRRFTQALEEMRQCAAFRRSAVPSLAKALQTGG